MKKLARGRQRPPTDNIILNQVGPSHSAAVTRKAPIKSTKTML
jgi:hypothetical protein